jgi:hypothetical protein
MNKIRFLLRLLLIGLLLAAGYWVYLRLAPKKPFEERTEISNHMIVEQIESIGKLELSKFYIKDIIEQKQIKDWWMPDSKIVLIISGEATGCIDLKKIDSTHIQVLPDKIRIKLPSPEICYTKVNHQESKVYNIEYEFFDKAKLIDRAYALAEKSIHDGALRMNILEHTKSNAIHTLKPLLQSFSGKEIELYF